MEEKEVIDAIEAYKAEAVKHLSMPLMKASCSAENMLRKHLISNLSI